MTKRDIRTAHLGDWSVEEVKCNSSWIFPQMMSLFNQLCLVKNPQGLISASQTLEAWKHHMESITEWSTWKKLWEVCGVPRSQVLSTPQTKNTRWSEGVPLIMSAFKEFRDINYSSWDWTDPKIPVMVGDRIWEGVTGPRHEWKVEEVLEFRGVGLRVKTGKKAGTDRTLTSYLPWGGVTDPDFKALPILSKYMVTQTWIYHPSIRHPLMICDWNNPDQLPQPLVHQDVLDTKNSTSKTHFTFEDIFNL